MTVLALYSNKGGVGKTAAAVNLSYLAALDGYETLICDLDPQSSATFYFRVKPRLKKKARGLTQAGKAIDRSIKGTDYESLDLLPADFSHRNLDLAFSDKKRSTRQLAKILKPFKKEYDLIVLDTPPTINIVAENIFTAADILLIPLIPTVLSLRTHWQLLNFLGEENYRLDKIYGFFSMVDRRKRMHHELMKAARENLDGILEADIPYLSMVERMGAERQPVPAFAPRTPAADAYRRLWEELREKL